MELDQEIIECEFPLLHLHRSLLCLDLIEGGLRLLDEGEDISHAQDSRSHSLGVEGLEITEALTDTGEFHGRAGHLTDRYRGSTAGVTVELGQDHAGQSHLLLESRSHVHRILAGHGIDYEQHLVGI